MQQSVLRTTRLKGEEWGGQGGDLGTGTWLGMILERALGVVLRKALGRPFECKGSVCREREEESDHVDSFLGAVLKTAQRSADLFSDPE